MNTVVILSEREAERLTERIKLTVESIDNSLYKLYNLLDEAQRSNAWQVLGFPSWTAYLVSLFDRPLRLPVEKRREVVAYLSDEGLSTRAIAPIVGVSERTAAYDVARSAGVQDCTPASSSEEAGAPVPNGTPEPESSPVGDGEEVAGPVEQPPYAPDPATIDLTTGEVLDDTVTVTEHTVTEKVRTVTGLDGKTYSAPAAKKLNRRALTDQARDAGWELRKAVERIERIREDDRYSRNQEEVAELLRGHLTYVIETCQGFLDDNNQSKEN